MIADEKDYIELEDLKKFYQMVEDENLDNYKAL